MMLSILSVFLQALLVLNYIFVIVMVFFERRNPAVTWAWLMLLLILPYVGFLFYLTFGMESRKHSNFLRKVKNDNEQYKKLLKSQNNNYSELLKDIDYKSGKDILNIDGMLPINDMVHLNYISGAGILTKNNSVSLFHDGTTKFESLKNDIINAKSFIHIQYYIIRNDKLGRSIIALLAQKAQQGVEVRLLPDGMGNVFNGKKFYAPLIKAGGKVSLFLSPHFFRMNFRNHRKICVIDGEIGYIGGFNIGDEYLGLTKRYGFWRDTHLRVVGDCVKELEICFSMDWNYVSKDTITLNDYYLPKIESPLGNVNMQIVSSGPDTQWSSVHYGYFKMMNEAEKSIYIATPYFVPDDSIFETLRIAALSGIDVRIIIPANPDHLFVYSASLSYLRELIETGVKCYQYKKGFIHSKMVAVDGCISSVGTANMDIRSFRLNFEINAFIYDKEITGELESQFIKDLDDCSIIDEAFLSSRPWYTRIGEAIARLISPLL